MTDWITEDLRLPYIAQTGRLEERLQAADKPGEHMWCVTGVWVLPDPEAVYRKAAVLDGTNLAGLAGVGCFKCEREYSRKLARQRCTGSLELQ